MKQVRLGVDNSEYRKETRPFGKGFIEWEVGSYYTEVSDTDFLRGKIRDKPFVALVDGREVVVVLVEKEYPPKTINPDRYKKFTEEEMLAVGQAAKLAGRVLEVTEGVVYFHGSGMDWWEGTPVSSQSFYRGEKIVIKVTEDVAISPTVGVQAGTYTFLVPNGGPLKAKQSGDGIPIRAGELRDGEGTYRGHGDDRIVGYRALSVPDV